MAGAIGILGGDRRQLYVAEAAGREGREVYLSGFEKLDTPGIRQLEAAELLRRCQIILLPMPATRDGKTLNAPFSVRPISLTDGFAGELQGKRVFAGMAGPLAALPGFDEVAVTDYAADEDLLTGNALLTAEGAIAAAITQHSGALAGSRCLVTGFGRIGKALCRLLAAMGANADCCARKPADRAAIQALGYGAPVYDDLTGEYDMVFNTVPAQVLTAKRLACFAPGTLLFELASAPGGIDRTAADRLGLPVIDLPGLPGKMAPRAAGELIWRAVSKGLAE